ncbi:L-threonylcarbamoyladenylate synthase [Lentisalinibacter orientalis]|uniref:L-threonylcarbamoyladenylate synthase n=1 Tax=Lentisalinibacter orientalis TaxID=2992241 RepID=UPI0038668801
MSQSVPIVRGPAAVERAAQALRDGGLVGMPTETVYGLAGDAANPAAVARIFAAKGRPRFNPLISHVASAKLAAREGELDERALALAEAFWPGPLTLVVPAAATGRTCDLARAGLGSIALRVPGHPVAQALLEAFGGPVSAPSANPSGRLSPTRPEDVARELGDGVALVLDGGPCSAGIESTIVSLLPGEPPRLLRPGAIERERIESIAGPVAEPAGESVTAPGQLASHYAPRAAIRLEAAEARDGEVLLGFGPNAPPEALNLSPAGDTVEAAANLYRMLRELDAEGADTIAVMPIPAEALGEAINDRLRRAAAPRG